MKSTRLNTTMTKNSEYDEPLAKNFRASKKV